MKFFRGPLIAAAFHICNIIFSNAFVCRKNVPWRTSAVLLKVPFGEDFESPNIDVNVQYFTENLINNQSILTIYRYMNEYRDESSIAWMDKYVAQTSGRVRFKNFMESMILSEPEVVKFKRRSIFSIGDGSMSEHSKLVEPRALATQICSVRDQIMKGI